MTPSDPYPTITTRQRGARPILNHQTRISYTRTIPKTSPRAGCLTSMHFCEAVTNTAEDGHTIPILTICAKPATHRIHGNLHREYWVCDQHQKDFTPKKGERIQIGTLP